MPYRWEPTAGVSGRYRDTSTGRYVQGATVRRELDRYLDTADPAKALAEALRGRQVSLADWEVAMRRHVKNTHLNAIAMERGGWANMTPADYGRAGQIVREQYGYLKNFAADIASGKQRLDGTLGVRAKLYTQAGRETFYRSKQANLQPGIDMVRSIKHARDSCRDCEYLNGKWFRVGDPAYSLPGRRQCNKNCRCTEEYGRQTADGVEAVEDVVTAKVVADAPQWRPAMTATEAAELTKNSVYQEPFYHFTTQEAAEGIRTEGFRLSDGVYGKGIYLTPDAEGAGIGRSFTTERLQIAVDVRNPVDVRGFSGLSHWMEERGLGDAEVDAAIVGSGHDALRVRFSNKPDYLVLFDKRRVVVIEE